MSHTKSQVSIEFISMFFIFLLFTTTVMIMYVVKNQEIIDRRTSLEAQSLLDDMVMTINTAVVRGDGFSIELELPYAVYQSDYSITINDSWVYVNITSKDILLFKSIFSKNITGTPEKGMNIVRNVNGVIYID